LRATSKSLRSGKLSNRDSYLAGWEERFATLPERCLRDVDTRHTETLLLVLVLATAGVGAWDALSWAVSGVKEL